MTNLNNKLVMAHILDLTCWFVLGITIGHYCLQEITMRKFSQSFIGTGVTFTKLAKMRDSKGRVDYARQEIDGIVMESDGYLSTVRAWDGTVHSNVENAELTSWKEVDANMDMPCLD